MTESLFQQIRTRKLIQWTAAYTAAAFAVLQAIDLLGDNFGWKPGFFRFAVIAVVTGFGIVLVLAWFHGERGAQRVTRVEGALLAAIVLLGGMVGWTLREPAARALPTGVRSVVVLPFDNLSGSPDSAYFAEGIAEDIRTQLAQIADLAVISRSSTRALQGANHSNQEIGRELNAGYLLEGSVRRVQNRVRITVRLVAADNNREVWSSDYDRELADVLAIQKEVAQEVAASLHASISPDERARLNRRPTTNPVAYDLMLRSFAFNEGNRSENEAAIALLRSAQQIDSISSDVHASLAMRFFAQTAMLGLPVAWADSAERAALRAIALDSLNPRAHYALAAAYMGKGRLRDARVEQINTLQLRPNDAAALAGLALIDIAAGEPGSAARWVLRSMPINPKSEHEPNLLAWVHLLFGDEAEALRWVERSLQIRPRFHFAQSVRVTIALTQGDSLGALRHAREMERDHADSPLAWAAVAAAATAAGDWDEVLQYGRRLESVGQPDATLPDLRIGIARALLAKGNPDSARVLLRKVAADNWRAIETAEVPAFEFWNAASAHALLGETAKALDAFERFAQKPLVPVSWIMHDPALRSLHEEPRFVAAIAASRARAAHQLTELRKDMARHGQPAKGTLLEAAR